ncbi:RNA-binding domain-containing protein [uncultured Campylobacter sp.]|uniref:AAA family ATPase n=1 Tax=uncultured Campylobacter sp. TaxID=218934 RepID=UPI00260CF80D|nr:RNA-binding domain-containing protein [uncultured Campylobacter sp.]
MQLLDIKRMAHNILENQNIESSFIEYKKSANFKDKILKTACAFANNYMNNEIGLLFVGIEEVDDKETGEKAIPKRPIEGIKESKIEGIENEIKSFNDRMESIEQEIREFSISDIDDDVNDFKNNIDAEISNINDYFADIANSNPKNVKNIQVCYSLEDNIIDNIIDEFASILNLKISATSKDYLRQVGYNSVLNAENTQNFIEHIPYRNSQAYNILIDIFSLDLNFEIYKLLIKKHLRDINQYKILKVLYDNKEFERSSFGQRCTAVIVMLLSLGNNPIIIDEPETHLDSLLIANYLVELIKQQKNGRQIIFATHNANFVLNADAELIVKLENIDGFSTSTSFTIEDLSHREDLLKLEGGKEAFKKREQKYDI